MTERLIGVIGPGIVGMPMAALLARALGPSATTGRVLVVQRDSATSGWKVGAINAGRSPIGGVEPGLDAIVRDAVAAGRLGASHDMSELADAEAVLVCVQTDRRGMGPDYAPLYDALDALAAAFGRRRAGLDAPLVIIESTLAPSSMTTLVRERFASHGLLEGRHVRLGNSPNRVMPGRLVQRVAESDKLVAGLSRETATAIARLYAGIVTRGRLHVTSSLAAEVVKTLENAYRDVRIALSAEIVRWCDARDVDFYALRDLVNRDLAQADAASADPSVVPSGALLVPTVGVGGHCLPKDGILLWWRRYESDPSLGDTSLILASRRINDASPAATIALAEREFGPMSGRRVGVLGAAYRFDAEDTRNSPSLALAQQLMERGATVRLHDPYVKPDDQNLGRTGLDRVFSQDPRESLRDAEFAFVSTGHAVYRRGLADLRAAGPALIGIVDASNLWTREAVTATGLRYAGIGRGRTAPTAREQAFAAACFRAVERGVANEVEAIIAFLNERFAADRFSRTSLEEVRMLAATCVTGCALPAAGRVDAPEPLDGFLPELARLAAQHAP